MFWSREYYYSRLCVWLGSYLYMSYGIQWFTFLDWILLFDIVYCHEVCGSRWLSDRLCPVVYDIKLCTPDLILWMVWYRHIFSWWLLNNPVDRWLTLISFLPYEPAICRCVTCRIGEVSIFSTPNIPREYINSFWWISFEYLVSLYSFQKLYTE